VGFAANTKSKFLSFSLYMEYGNTKRAKPALKKLLEIAPDNAVGRFLLGKVHMALGDFKDASAEFEKAAPALDGDIEFHYQKEITHFELRDYEGARKEFGRVQSINPGYKLTGKYLEEIARKFEPGSIPAKPTNIRPASLRESNRAV
jgi:tetratricopeptide (TPR) repeat protein